MRMKKNDIVFIAKRTVQVVGERDYRTGESLGRCHEISREIVKILKSEGVYNARVISPVMFKDGGFSAGGHKAVLLPNQELIVDTQLWQYGKWTPLSRRKVVFTYSEYKKKGMSW